MPNRNFPRFFDIPAFLAHGKAIKETKAKLQTVKFEKEKLRKDREYVEKEIEELEKGGRNDGETDIEEDITELRTELQKLDNKKQKLNLWTSIFFGRWLVFASRIVQFTSAVASQKHGGNEYNENLTTGVAGRSRIQASTKEPADLIETHDFARYPSASSYENMADNETRETNTTENRVLDGLSEHAPQNKSKLLPQDEREDSDSEEEHTQEDGSEENEPKSDRAKEKTRSAGDSHKKHSCKKESHKRDPSKKHSHKKESRKKHSHKDNSVSKIDTRSSSMGFSDVYTVRTLKVMWNKGFADLKDVQEKLEKLDKKKKKLEEEEKELKKWLNDLHENIKKKRS
ncbi:unnamed protein product [Fusarium fujikuroi]|nr:unnamed protein product [Fusarium fujikuroi]